MTRTPTGSTGSPSGGGYESGFDLDDADLDPELSVAYDGGLQAVAAGGRVAGFRAPGATATPADVDSPFLGLFKRGEPGAPPATEPKRNGFGRHQQPDLPTIDPLQLPATHPD